MSNDQAPIWSKFSAAEMEARATHSKGNVDIALDLNALRPEAGLTLGAGWSSRGVLPVLFKWPKDEDDFWLDRSKCNKAVAPY